MDNLVVKSNKFFDLILSNADWVFDDCRSQLDRFQDEALESFLHQIIALSSLCWDELIELEVFELGFGLAFDHNDKGVRIFVEELLINFWFEVVNLCEVDIIQLDQVIELFSYYPVDCVLESFLNASLLIAVVTSNIDDLLIVLVQNLGEIVVGYVGGWEDVFVDFLQWHLLRKHLNNASNPYERNQRNFLKQMRIFNILLFYEYFNML